MATAELITNIKDGNTRKSISYDKYVDSIKPMYQELANVDITEKFNPKIHLKFTSNEIETTSRLTMSELGIHDENAISEIGVSDPFALFTDTAVEIMRAELLREEVFTKYSRVSHLSTSGLDCVVRGYAKDTCPFTYTAWTHPATVAAVSAMAGVELEVIMDYEIAHINIGMQSEEMAENQLLMAKRKKSMTDKFDDDIPAIVGWHKDSYPFVCVLMLSDTETSIGTETLLKKGNGEIIGTPNPSKGKAVVLQGGLINHLAPKPLGFTERITAVTSYRAKNPMTKDCSVLRSVKPEVNFGSNFNTFYPDWVNYRMKLVAEKCELIKNEIEKEANEGKTFRKEDWMQSLKDLENYVATTWKEMVVTNEEYARAL